LNNTILNALQASGLGAHIRNINVSSPTCADDIALLGCKGHELKSLLDIVQYSIGRDLVTINPANRLECPKVKIDNNEITEVKKAKHLGLIRKAVLISIPYRNFGMTYVLQIVSAIMGDIPHLAWRPKEPIEAVIDRNTLSFLGGIIRNKSIIEFAILERELSISKTNGNLRNKSKQNTLYFARFDCRV
jgi:hypothetical protein